MGYSGIEDNKKQTSKDGLHIFDSLIIVIIMSFIFAVFCFPFYVLFSDAKKEAEFKETYRYEDITITVTVIGIEETRSKKQYIIEDTDGWKTRVNRSNLVSSWKSSLNFGDKLELKCRRYFDKETGLEGARRYIRLDDEWSNYDK